MNPNPLFQRAVALSDGIFCKFKLTLCYILVIGENIGLVPRQTPVKSHSIHPSSSTVKNVSNQLFTHLAVVYVPLVFYENAL